jgi:UDP-glucuronate decarboxylase
MIDLSSLAGKTIRIAGATGLIGSHMAKTAREAGAIVWPLAHGSFTEDLLKADIVLHCAGYGQPSRFTYDPISTIQVNTDLTINLIRSTKCGGTFLFCSSSEIYSGLHKLASESDIGTTTPQHPRSAYIEGKRAGEAIVHAYHSMGDNAMSARIALAYGPGTKKHDTRVLNQFIEKALVQKKIELLDSGEAIRTYCYIDDVVETLWSIVLRGKQEVYNVGGYSVTSIANLAKRIGYLTEAEVIIPKTSNSVVGAPSEVRMDLTRTKMAFWKTEYVNLDEGLKRTIEYQRGLYEQI